MYIENALFLSLLFVVFDILCLEATNNKDKNNAKQSMSKTTNNKDKNNAFLSLSLSLSLLSLSLSLLFVVFDILCLEATQRRKGYGKLIIQSVGNLI